MNTNTLQQFLEKEIFKEPLKVLKEITRGGNSINYKAETNHLAYLIKLIPLEEKDNAKRLIDLLSYLENYPDFYTAHLQHKTMAILEQNIIIVTDFITGHKLKYFELTPQTLDSIMKTYQNFSEIPFERCDFVGTQRQAKLLYEKNKQQLEELISRKNGQQKRLCLKMAEYNQIFYDSVPEINRKLSIIHGDASLNNLLVDAQNRTAFLDLELIRQGFPVEDAAELLLASLLPHYIFLSPRRKLKTLVQAINDRTDFTSTDWQYGIGLHFLHYINRRLRGGKLFKSYRKDWLVLRYLKKFDLITKMLKQCDFSTSENTYNGTTLPK